MSYSHFAFLHFFSMGMVLIPISCTKLKAFDCVDHNKLWKILQEMEIPDHLICLLRNLYAGQEATVRTGHGHKRWLRSYECGLWLIMAHTAFCESVLCLMLGQGGRCGLALFLPLEIGMDKHSWHLIGVIMLTFPSMNYIWSLNLVKYFINVNYREWIPTFLIVNFLGSQITTLMFITAWLWLDNAVLKECVLRS